MLTPQPSFGSQSGKSLGDIAYRSIDLPPINMPGTAVLFSDTVASTLESPIEDIHELKRHYSNLIIQIDRARPSLLRIDPERRASELEWTVTEIFGHMIDTDNDIWWPRIEALLVEERPLFQNIDPQELVVRHHWATLPIDDVLSQLLRLRWNHSMRVNSLPHSAFDRSGIHPSYGELSLAQILQILVGNDAHCLSVIRSLLEDSSRQTK